MTQRNPRVLVAKAFALEEAARVLRRHRILYEPMHLPPGVTREMVHQEFMRLPEAFMQRRSRILK